MAYFSFSNSKLLLILAQRDTLITAYCVVRQPKRYLVVRTWIRLKYYVRYTAWFSPVKCRSGIYKENKFGHQYVCWWPDSRARAQCKIAHIFYKYYLVLGNLWITIFDSVASLKMAEHVSWNLAALRVLISILFWFQSHGTQIQRWFPMLRPSSFTEEFSHILWLGYHGNHHVTPFIKAGGTVNSKRGRLSWACWEDHGHFVYLCGLNAANIPEISAYCEVLSNHHYC